MVGHPRGVLTRTGRRQPRAGGTPTTANSSHTTGVLERKSTPAEEPQRRVLRWRPAFVVVLRMVASRGEQPGSGLRRCNAASRRSSNAVELRRLLPALDQMLVRVEEVNRLAGPARAAFVTRSAHVADSVERVAVFEAGVAHAAEGLIELGVRHREREML